MLGRKAGIPIGGVHLSLLTVEAGQERGVLVVVVYASCCQSKTNRRYEMQGPADGVGAGRLGLGSKG
jgi:hypothetical protein